MQLDFFESSNISLILAWLGSIYLFGKVFHTILLSVIKYENVPRLLSIFLALSIILLSPMRYMLFQASLASSYVVQSFSAFFGGLLMSFFVVPVFGLIHLLVIGAPIALAYILLANKERITFIRGCVAGLLVPLVCVIVSSVFYWSLSYAGGVVGWLANPKDLIKATNGPAAVIFKYVASPLTPTIVPSVYSDTPQKDIDLLRCHVASTYLNDKKFGYFVKHQYPEIYEKGPR